MFSPRFCGRFPAAPRPRQRHPRGGQGRQPPGPAALPSCRSGARARERFVGWPVASKWIRLNCGFAGGGGKVGWRCQKKFSRFWSLVLTEILTFQCWDLNFQTTNVYLWNAFASAIRGKLTHGARGTTQDMKRYHSRPCYHLYTWRHCLYWLYQFFVLFLLHIVSSAVMLYWNLFNVFVNVFFFAQFEAVESKTFIIRLWVERA